jgi:hypothetical protein
MGIRAGQEMIAGDSEAALEQVGFSPGEGPSVGEPLATVVASKDHDGVFALAVGLQRFENTADLNIHRLDHASERLLRSAVEIFGLTLYVLLDRKR